MRKVILSVIIAAIPTAAFAQQGDVIGLSGGTTPPTPDCQATKGQPVLLVRNMIEGTNVTGVYAKPWSAYSPKTGVFLSTGSLIGGQTNLLGSRVLKGKKPESFVGGDDDSPNRCGFPIQFGAFGFNKTCSSDKLENLYQVQVALERDGTKYSVTLTKNVCDETTLDLLPGIPPDGADKMSGKGLSGYTPDCETTVGEPKLLIRNLIPGATISSIRARPISDYNRASHQFMTTTKGVVVSTKPIEGFAFGSIEAAKAVCGLPINFGKYDFRTDCSQNKIENLYEMTVTLQRHADSYNVVLTRDVCEETMLDLAPGIPASKN